MPSQIRDDVRWVGKMTVMDRIGSLTNAKRGAASCACKRCKWGSSTQVRRARKQFEIVDSRLTLVGRAASYSSKSVKTEEPLPSIPCLFATTKSELRAAISAVVVRRCSDAGLTDRLAMQNLTPPSR